MLQIPQDPNSSDPSRAENQMIVALAVSPSEENLVVATAVNQLYTITLSGTELARGASGADFATFEILAQSFHSSTVSGLDVCIRKPLIATCSLDRSIRIWNYETW